MAQLSADHGYSRHVNFMVIGYSQHGLNLTPDHMAQTFVVKKVKSRPIRLVGRPNRALVHWGSGIIKFNMKFGTFLATNHHFRPFDALPQILGKEREGTQENDRT